MTSCNNCGSKISGGESFCSACGAPVPRVAESSNSRTTLILTGTILGVIILLASFTGGFFFLRTVLSQSGERSAAAENPLARDEEQAKNKGFGFVTSFDGLKTPLGVATGRGENVYIANTGAAEIVIADGGGTRIKSVVSIRDAAGQEITFPSPYGIAVDDERNKVYICDFVVRVLDKDSQFQYDLIPPPEVTLQDTRPNEVALLGDRVLVTSRDGIYIFDSKGKYLEKWGSRGKEVGQYDFPNGIAADPNTGNIFVVDTNNWRVVSLNQQGKVRWTMGNQDNGTVPGPFHLPRSVAVAPDGLVYITDSPDRVVVLNQDGELVSIFGKRGTGDGQFNFPEGLAITPDGRLYVADRENNRIQLWQLGDAMPAASEHDKEVFSRSLKKN